MPKSFQQRSRNMARACHRSHGAIGVPEIIVQRHEAALNAAEGRKRAKAAREARLALKSFKEDER